MSSPGFAFIGASANHPERDWKIIETEHFHLHYYKEYEKFAHLVSRVVEDAYYKITTDLGAQPQEKIPIILTEDEFFNGYAEPLRNRIVIDPRLSLASTIGLNRFIIHELTHIINFEAYRTPVFMSKIMNTSGVPPWFSEGLAQYEAEYWAPENDRMLRLHALNNSILDPGERNIFVLLRNMGSEGYNEGYAIVRYWFETYGHDKVAKLLSNYRAGNLTFPDAVRMTFGKSMQALEAEWRTKIQDLYQEQIATRYQDIQAAKDYIPYKKRKTYYMPRYSKDGKYLSYFYSGGHPMIRGHIYNYLNLYVEQPVTAEDKKKQAEKFEKKCKDKKDKEFRKCKDKHKIRNKLKVASRVGNYDWAPKGHEIAYTHLAVNPFGTSTTHISTVKLKLNKKGKLEKDGEPIDITPKFSAHSPTWSPDGTHMAIVKESDERDAIVLYDHKAKKVLKTLVQAKDFRQYQHLQWSPDGTKIVAEVYLPGDGASLLLIDPKTGAQTQLTDSSVMYADKQPTWSPDNRFIYFISTRTRYAELYRYDMVSKSEERLSHIYSGLEVPTLSPDGKDLMYIRHHVLGTSLSKVPVTKLKSWEKEQNTIEVAEFTNMDSNLTPSPLKKYPVKDYSSTIGPEIIIPVTSRDEKGDQLGFLMRFSDTLQKQSLTSFFLYGLNSSRISYSLGYANSMWGPTLGIQFSDFPTLSFTTDGSQFFIQRDQNVTLSITRPLFNKGTGDTGLTRIKRVASLEASVINQSNLTPEVNAVVPDQKQLRQGWNNRLRLIWSENGANRSRTDGYIYTLNLSGASKLWLSQFEFIQGNADFRYYWPFYKDHVLAFRGVVSGYRGETRPLLLGGPPLDSILFLNFQDVIPLRGFTIASIQGDVMTASQVEYRFPIFKDLNWVIGGHFVDQLRGALFMDMGDTFFIDRRTQTPSTNPEKFANPNIFRPYPNISMGAELRLRAVLSNRTPFNLYFGVGKAITSFKDLDPATRESGLYTIYNPVEFYGGFMNIF